MDKIYLTLFVWQMTAVDKLRARREAGQGTLEYVGMVAVAAVIAAAVIGIVKGADLGTWVDGFIQKMKSAVG